MRSQISFVPLAKNGCSPLLSLRKARYVLTGATRKETTNMRTVCATVAVVFALLLVANAAFAADIAKETKATVMGKIEVKTEKLANKEVKVAYITVSEAKGMDGKAMPALNRKTLKVMGAKAMDAEKLAGKEVTLTGTIKGNTIQATQVMEKKAATPTAAPAPAAK